MSTRLCATVLLNSILILLAWNIPAQAHLRRVPATTGSVEVHVTDSSGAPLVRATAQLLETKQGALTKENGTARIINVTPGTYTLVVKYAAHKPQTKTGVKVEAD